MESKNSNGAIPLFYAAHHDQNDLRGFEAVNALIAAGANVNVGDHEGRSPLAAAIVTSDIDVANVLHQHAHYA